MTHHRWDQRIYDWVLGVRLHAPHYVWPKPIKLCGGPGNGRVYRLQFRTGDTFYVPVSVGLAASYADQFPQYPAFKKAKYVVNRYLGLAFYAGISR